MKPANPECVILCSKCTKIHLQASGGQKNFLGQATDPQRGEGSERGQEGREEGAEGRFGPPNNSDIAPPTSLSRSLSEVLGDSILCIGLISLRAQCQQNS